MRTSDGLTPDARSAADRPSDGIAFVAGSDERHDVTHRPICVEAQKIVA